MIAYWICVKLAVTVCGVVTLLTVHPAFVGVQLPLKLAKLYPAFGACVQVLLLP